MYLLSKWDKNVSLEKIMTQASEEQLERQKTYQKMSKPFKLYL